MTRRNLFVAITLLTIVAVMLGACGQATPTKAPAQPTAAPAQPTAAPAQPTAAPTTPPEPIKIGWIAPKTGTNAILGEWDERGILLAFEAKNAAGGIHGRMLQLIQEDDEADPTKAVALAQKLITQDKVVAAFACTNSTTTLAVVPVFMEYKIPHLTSALNAAITQKGSKYVFRDCPAGPAYEKSIVDFMVGKGFKKFAIISDTSAYGKGEAEYQTNALKAHGLEPLAVEWYGIEDKDFTGQLTKILQTNPEVILFGGSEVASGLIAKQARQLGFTGQFAGGAAIGTTKFVEVAGDAAEGTYYSNPYISNDLNDLTRDFAARYKARWGDEPESHGAKAYDGATVLIMALEKAYPDITPERITEELHKICGVQGLQGTICYDENGEGLHEVGIGVVKDGKLTPVSVK